MGAERRHATADDESPLFFDSGRETLFGIVTHPTAPPVGTALVVLTGAGQWMCAGRNGISVRICRAVAGAGFHAMRFDYHGLGESTGTLGALDLDEPQVEDVEAATNVLRRQGIERFVLLGTCFGARTALSSAARIPGVQAVAMGAIPIKDLNIVHVTSDRLAGGWSRGSYVWRMLRPSAIPRTFSAHRRQFYRRVLRAKWQAFRSRDAQEAAPRGGEDRWVSRVFLDDLETVIERGVKMLFVLGTVDDSCDKFQRARRGRLGEALERPGSLAEVAIVEGSVHGLTSIPIQDEFTELLDGWLRRLGGAVGLGTTHDHRHGRMVTTQERALDP
ncbi:MAG: serine aminopeptidase domain-containing protein [Actinomycetota bacterium]